MLRGSAVVLVVTLFCASTAFAYVLPADVLLRMLTDKRRSMKIDDLSIHLNTQRSGIEEPIDERLYLKRPERLRLVQEDGDGAVYVEREGKRARGTATKLTRVKGPVTDLTATLFVTGGEDVDQMTRRLRGRLRSLGIDTSVVSLGRCQRRAVYVIGAKSQREETPQLWLDKLSLLPVRIVLYVAEKSTAPRVRHETRFLEYGSPVAGNWFPRVIEDYVNGELVRRAEVTQVQVNQSLPETMFDLP